MQDGFHRGLPPPSEDNAPIYVTRPQLPPFDDMLSSLRQIWDSRVLTNGGAFHQRFESALRQHLGVAQVALFANATLGLVTALQALRITGEVITTPYSFVATSHALLWNGIKPVFVDVQPDNLNLDPARIEAAITSQTTAIMPVHCYGHSCDVRAIRQIADAHGLKVIYDAAHAFGVNDEAGSILNHGDLSVLSFHATKVFNTFEGGAIVCGDAETKLRLDQLKNFGYVDEVTVVAPGINAKMSEFNAALGLLQLDHIGDARALRRAVDLRYRSALSGVPGIHCMPAGIPGRHNHAYFPIRVTSPCALSRDELYAALGNRGIHARRYFYPLISAFPMYSGLPSAAPANLPVATQAAEEILCLPIYPDLAPPDQQRVIDVVCRGAVQR